MHRTSPTESKTGKSLAVVISVPVLFIRQRGHRQVLRPTTKAGQGSENIIHTKNVFLLGV